MKRVQRSVIICRSNWNLIARCGSHLNVATASLSWCDVCIQKGYPDKSHCERKSLALKFGIMILRECFVLLAISYVDLLVSRDITIAAASGVVTAPLRECGVPAGLHQPAPAGSRGLHASKCRYRPAASEAALRGMAAAAAECRHQFRAQRWNCSVLGTYGGAADLQLKSNLARGLPQRGYREVAFARAILTAGIVLEVAKQCSIGLLSECTCEPRGWKKSINAKTTENGAPKVHWKWRGCSQALFFAMEFSREIMEANEGAEDAPGRVHQHNSNVGRLVVASLMKLRCKCHGMSGSCSLRTCWQSPPDLKQVGMALKSRFASAVMVTTDNTDGDIVIRLVAENDSQVYPKGEPLPSVIPSRTSRLLRRRRGSAANDFSLDLDEQLLYIEKSPSFCERDAAADVSGTSGRRCRRDGITAVSSSESTSIAIAMAMATPEPDELDCSILCCGRGFNLMKASPSKCRCRFLWCCRVVCDICTKDREDWVAVCK